MDICAVFKGLTVVNGHTAENGHFTQPNLRTVFAVLNPTSLKLLDGSTAIRLTPNSRTRLTLDSMAAVLSSSFPKDLLAGSPEM